MGNASCCRPEELPASLDSPGEAVASGRGVTAAPLVDDEMRPAVAPKGSYISFQVVHPSWLPSFPADSSSSDAGLLGDGLKTGGTDADNDGVGQGAGIKKTRKPSAEKEIEKSTATAKSKLRAAKAPNSKGLTRELSEGHKLTKTMSEGKEPSLAERKKHILKERAAHNRKVEDINRRMAKVMEEARNSPNSGGLLALMKESLRSELVDSSRALRGRPEKMDVSKVHYILHTPMEGPWPAQLNVFVFASGCFWGAEKGAWRLPGGGVHSTAAGYAGGYTPNPTYNEVCTGQTGAAEAVQVVYDPSRLSVVDLLRWFWESHDPTQGMGQGGDRGTEYRSGLYCFDDDQRQLAEASKRAYGRALRQMGKGQGPITTEIRMASEFSSSPGQVFYYAEDYHQQYLAKPGSRNYCSAEPLSVPLPPFDSWVPEGLSHYMPRLPEAFWVKHGPKPHCVVDAPHQPVKWP
jgi:peptide-methionine (S)-S-oxide reductase